MFLCMWVLSRRMKDDLDGVYYVDRWFIYNDLKHPKSKVNTRKYMKVMYI